MTAKHDNPPFLFKHGFLRLPRELRDMIYAEVLSNSAPITFDRVRIEPAGLALLATDETESRLKPEILEALYTHSTFNIHIPESPPEREHLHGFGDSAYPQYEKFIRKVIVFADEIRLPTTALEDLERSCRMPSSNRDQWEGLLKLPRLEHLTIRLQKHVYNYFHWANFSPVIVQLRKNLPKLQVIFSVSFDELLESVWYAPDWENYSQPGRIEELPYEPMGFVDVTELIDGPTEEDFAYVEEYLPHEENTYSRDSVSGLFNETASQRRALALHYVVKEPALLRVRIMQHYEVYKSFKCLSKI